MPKKKIYVLLSMSVWILVYFQANATNYYLSNSGNDNNTGTNLSSPWQSLEKLNKFKKLEPGDTVFFKKGDVFYGSLRLTNSGLKGRPIVYSSYGAGAKPKITGFTEVNQWSNVGNNIWESRDIVSNLPYINIAVVDNLNTPMGRYPNSGYITYYSKAGNKNVITSECLSKEINWTGGEIVIKKVRWAIEKSKIVSHTEDILEYKDAGVYKANSDFGFFIQDDIRTLDTDKEWYFNPKSKKINIYSIKTPGKVQAPSLENLVIITSNYIIIEGVKFIGSNNEAVKLKNCSSVIIRDCDIEFAGTTGVYGQEANDISLISNSFNNTNGSSIKLTRDCSNAVIRKNRIKNSSIIPGFAKVHDFGSIALDGDNALVEYNSIDSSGYNGIVFFGNYTTIKNNFINNSCLIQDDGGGIYTDGIKHGREIIGNIILNTKGNSEGTDSPNDLLAHGIYIDEKGSFVKITDNSIAGCQGSGIFIHDASNLIIERNTLYDIGIKGNWIRGSIMYQVDKGMAIEDLHVSNNIFFAKTTDQVCMFLMNFANSGVKLFKTLHSNVYTRPVDENGIIITNVVGNNWTGEFRNLDNWKNYSKQEENSKAFEIKAVDTTGFKFLYNATLRDKEFLLDGEYVDAFGRRYDRSITLSTFTSVILIKDTKERSTTNSSVFAGKDKFMQLPVDYVSLSGYASDSVVSVRWTLVSGPYPVTITDFENLNAEVRGLKQGIYYFELKVFGSNGVPITDTVAVHVQAEPDIPRIAYSCKNVVVTLPINKTTLLSEGTDIDGVVYQYLWTKVSGPDSYFLVNKASANTILSNLVEGVYLFELQITDNNVSVGRDTLTVTVNPPPNIPPVAIAGGTRSITLPLRNLQIVGKGDDPDGKVVSFQWTKISGPAEIVIKNSHSSEIEVNGLTQGNYQLELCVMDDKGDVGRDTMLLIVNPRANVFPIANAGPDMTITWQGKPVIVYGTAQNPDGLIASYSWVQISGPKCKMWLTDSLRVSIEAPIEGKYEFELTVTDNDIGTGKDTMALYIVSKQTPPSKLAISLYPNPTQDFVLLKLKNSNADSQISIYVIDSKGRIVTSLVRRVPAGIVEETLDLRRLQKGVYFISTFFNSKRMKSFKLVKE